MRMRLHRITVRAFIESQGYLKIMKIRETLGVMHDDKIYMIKVLFELLLKVNYNKEGLHYCSSRANSSAEEQWLEN